MTVHCIARGLELGIINALQQHPTCRLTQLNDALIHLYEKYTQSERTKDAC